MANKWHHEDECKYGAQYLGPDEYDNSSAIATISPLYSMCQRTDGARPPSEWLVTVHGNRIGKARTIREAKQMANTALLASSNNPTVRA